MATIGVFAKIFDDSGKILCVKKNYGDYNWTTPGGRVEDYESPVEALEREVLEETGYIVKAGSLIGVYAKPYKDDLVLSFRAELRGHNKKWKPDDEISEVGFFPRESIPKPIAFHTLQRIKDAFDSRSGIVRVFGKPDLLRISIE